MAQFLIRIIDHFVTEVITKRLANSRAFQQFALKTHKNVEKARRVVNEPEEAEKLVRETLKRGEKAKEDAGSIAANFERFKAALQEEVSRDFGGGKAKSNGGTNRRPSGNRRTSKK